MRVKPILNLLLLCYFLTLSFSALANPLVIDATDESTMNQSLKAIKVQLQQLKPPAGYRD